MDKALETQVLDERNFLDFEKVKTQSITLSQLERTCKENDVYGNPLKGIYHYELINRITSLCNEHGYQVDIWDMFAAQNRDRNAQGVVLLPKVEQEMNLPKAVEAHILRRVFANITIKDFDDETYTTNIAVGFHQKGIQVGFGNMVKFCHNQCMLGASQYASTYSDRGRGNEKMDIDGILIQVKSWLENARRIVTEEREKIEKMKGIDVPAEHLFKLIGMLTSTRVAVDSSNKDIHINQVYPLNSTQINAFTEDMLIKYKKFGRISVWDLYDSATELYKADRMDIPNVLPQNRAFVEFLETQYDI